MQGIDIIFVIWAMIFVFVPFLGGKEKGGGWYWAEGTRLKAANPICLK